MIALRYHSRFPLKNAKLSSNVCLMSPAESPGKRIKKVRVVRSFWETRTSNSEPPKKNLKLCTWSFVELLVRRARFTRCAVGRHVVPFDSAYKGDDAGLSTLLPPCGLFVSEGQDPYVTKYSLIHFIHLYPFHLKKIHTEAVWLVFYIRLWLRLLTYCGAFICLL